METTMPIRKIEKYEDTPLYRLRHSASHVMAQAVMELFPGQAKFAIGPSIEDGFYYDFALPRPLTPEDLETIEASMKEIIKARYPFERKEISRPEAEEMFADQPYKLELIADMPEDEVISIYTQGEFTDLCRGPHVDNTEQVNPGAFKLLKVA